jgi:hypothetical protein
VVTECVQNGEAIQQFQHVEGTEGELDQVLVKEVISEEGLDQSEKQLKAKFMEKMRKIIRQRVREVCRGEVMELPEKDIMQEVDQVVEGLWKSLKLGEI